MRKRFLFFVVAVSIVILGGLIIIYALYGAYFFSIARKDISMDRFLVTFRLSTSTDYTKAEKVLAEDLKIIIWQQGKETIIDHENPYFQELRNEVEDFLIFSDNALYELVLNETISNIKNDWAIELKYSESRQFKINNPVDSRNLIQVDRILVPLAGYYSPQTVFYGLNSYSSGPFINSTGHDRQKRIRDIVRRIEELKEKATQ